MKKAELIDALSELPGDAEVLIDVKHWDEPLNLTAIETVSLYSLGHEPFGSLTPTPGEPLNVVAAAQDAVHKAIKALEAARDAGELTEVDLPDDTEIAPDIFARFLMHYFGCEGFRPTLKRSLVEMADEMGPDYITQLRSAGAFMAKVDEFR